MVAGLAVVGVVLVFVVFEGFGFFAFVAAGEGYFGGAFGCDAGFGFGSGVGFWGLGSSVLREVGGF